MTLPGQLTVVVVVAFWTISVSCAEDCAPLPWQFDPRVAVTLKLVVPGAVEPDVVILNVEVTWVPSGVVTGLVPKTAAAPVGNVVSTPSVTVQGLLLPLNVTVTVP